MSAHLQFRKGPSWWQLLTGAKRASRAVACWSRPGTARVGRRTARAAGSASVISWRSPAWARTPGLRRAPD